MYCHPDGPGGGSSANAAAGDDLYDDVLAAGASSSSDAVKDEKSSELRSPSGDRSESKYPGRKYQVYVGNLTWWTTDQDIQGWMHCSQVYPIGICICIFAGFHQI